jgi:hypothetical protein
MRLFELLNQNTQDPSAADADSEEDDQGKFDAGKVDQNLQDIAQGVGDENAQPDLPMGAQAQPPELDPSNMKPLDDALIAQIKSMPYVTNNKFDSKSKLAPLKIAAMKIQELSSLKDMVRYKMQMATMSANPGLDDDDTMEYYNNLLRFVNTILAFKKSNTKSQMAQYNQTPSYQQQRPSSAANDNTTAQKTAA